MVDWNVLRLTMIQWLNLTKCGLFFNIVSPAIHTLLLSVLQRLDSRSIVAFILLSWSSKKSSTADMTSSLVWYCFWAKCFSCWGTENRWCQIRRIWTSSKPQSRTAAIATADLCAGALSWWNRTLFISFPVRFEMSLVQLFWKFWISYPMWVYLEGNNAVSIRRGWI